MTQITDDIHFVWQAQFLVKLEGDLDHWWCSFCVAGAVFGEVGGWLFVAGAALRDILGDSRSAICCILQYKIVSKIAGGRSPKRRVRDDDFIVGLSSNRLSIGGSTSGSFGWSLELKDFVAGAVLGEFERWLYLLRALEMTFHMWPQRRSPQMVVCLVRESPPKWPSIELSCLDIYLYDHIYSSDSCKIIHFLGIISQVALDFGNNWGVELQVYEEYGGSVESSVLVKKVCCKDLRIRI